MRSKPQTIKIHKPNPAVLLFTLLFFVLLSGCARPPWTTQGLREEPAGLEQLINNLQTRERSCPQGLTAQAIFNWQAPASSIKLDGSLQLLIPDAFKAVALSPLGQPLFIITANDTTFQAIDIPAAQVLQGNVQNLLSHYNIDFNQAPLATWLSGRFSTKSVKTQRLGWDKAGRGYWLKIKETGNSAEIISHVLIDLKSQDILIRQAINHNGQRAATIIYNDRDEIQACRPPQNIEIKDLPYGARLTITLNQIHQDDKLQPADFTMQIPSSFTRTQLPE